MTWGGLRGAVGLALALQVAHHDEIDSETVGIRVSRRLIHCMCGVRCKGVYTETLSDNCVFVVTGIFLVSPCIHQMTQFSVVFSHLAYHLNRT